MLIEVSGIDGSGKSTCVDHLSRWAHEAGVACYQRPVRSTYRRILGGIAASRGLRSWRELFDQECVQLATALEVLQYVATHITPINFPGQMIITENYRRYWLATAVADKATNMSQLEAIYAQLPRPDLSLHFDSNADVAYDRILARSKGDHVLRSGGKERLSRLWAAYEDKLSDHSPYRTVRISTLTSLRQTLLALSETILEATRPDKAIHDALNSRPMPALTVLK